MPERFSAGDIVYVGRMRPYKAEFIRRADRSSYLVKMLEGPDNGREVNVVSGSVRKNK